MWRCMLQIGALNLNAMLLALVACKVPPAKQLDRRKPPSMACFRASLILLAGAAIGLQVIQIGVMRFLCTRAWYTRGTGRNGMVGYGVFDSDVAQSLQVVHHPTEQVACSKETPYNMQQPITSAHVLLVFGMIYSRQRIHIFQQLLSAFDDL